MDRNDLFINWIVSGGDGKAAGTERRKKEGMGGRQKEGLQGGMEEKDKGGLYREDIPKIKRSYLIHTRIDKKRDYDPKFLISESPIDKLKV